MSSKKIVFPPVNQKPKMSLLRMLEEDMWCIVDEEKRAIFSDQIFRSYDILFDFRPGILLRIHLSRGGGAFDDIDKNPFNSWIRDEKPDTWYPIRVTDGGIIDLIAFSSGTVLRPYAPGTVTRVYGS